MTINLAEICYKRNYLTDVIARIDFVDEAKCLSGKVLPTPIQEAIRGRYEIFEPGKAQIQDVSFSNGSVSTKHEEFERWTYHGAEREKSINLCKKNVDISLKRYANYDQFKLDVLNPIKSIQEVERESYVARTGLRFINIFSGLLTSISEIPEYFSPMLSGQFSGIFEVENCSRSFLITEYLYGEIKLRLQTGIFNPDFPAKIKKLDFIIDIDAFIDTPHSFSDVSKLIDDLHQRIQKHFEASITEKMRAKLNESE